MKKPSTRNRKSKIGGHFNVEPTFLEADVAAAPPRSDAWLPLPGSDPRPLRDVHDGDCRWPVYEGDQPRLFCGLPVFAEGRNYCAAHQTLGTRELPPAKKGPTA